MNLFLLAYSLQINLTGIKPGIFWPQVAILTKITALGSSKLSHDIINNNYFNSVENISTILLSQTFGVWRDSQSLILTFWTGKKRKAEKVKKASKKKKKRHADSDLSDQEPEPEEEPEEVALKQRSSSRKSKKEKVS